MASLSPNAKQQFFTNSGALAAGCLLYTYATGTTTPLATYSNRAGSSANANPIVLDARGEATIYLLDQEYRYVLKSADGLTTYWTRDNVASGLYEVRADLASSEAAYGAALVGWKQPDASATAQTVLGELVRTVRVEHFGAVGDGVTDDAAAIQAAINYAESIGGGKVVFLDKLYIVGTGLTVDSHNVFLQGCGYQKHSTVGALSPTRWSQYGGTILQWGGAAGGTMLTFAPPVTGPLLMGCGMDGITLDGNATADYGLKVFSCQRFHAPSIHVADCVVRQVWFDVHPSGAWTSADPRDCQYITVGELHTRCYLAGALASEGVFITGDTIANTSRCHFGFVAILHKDGSGLRIKSADGIQFDAVLVGRISGGTGPGVRIEGGATTDVARALHFGFMEAGPGGLEVVTNTVAPHSIVIDSYSLNNGTPVPNIGLNCQVSYTIDTGAERVYCGSSSAQVKDTLLREFSTAGAIIGTRKFSARNSANAVKDYAAVVGFLVDSTSGSEDGRLYFQNMLAGAATNVGYIGAGTVLGSAGTGGDKGDGTLNITADYYRGGVKVLGARDTGWTNAMTGTANKATSYATGTITLVQLAERVKALQDALTTHGIIGA